jgi:preprotein translocase subunit YajC|tara:strand:+ start:578 stop:862 length:285 start_codon:yes stop_codon:yes gene_type:complete
MIEGIIITILGVLVVILGFTTFNLLRKNEKQEDILMNYLNYLDSLSKIIEVSEEKLKKLDETGVFKSDDEVGFFFESVKELQKILNDFKIKRIK